MSKLPADLSGQELRKALQRVGFVLVRQRGSHMILRREVPKARVIIPDHKTIRLGTLSQILKAAELTIEHLLELL